MKLPEPISVSNCIHKLKQREVHTLIPGDMHIGSRRSQSATWLEIINRVPHKKVVYAGDLFDTGNINKLTESDWQVLRGVVVAGNHDSFLMRIKKTPFGSKLPVYREYVFTVNRRKFLVLHGDQFDVSSARAIYSTEGIEIKVRHFFSDLERRQGGEPDLGSKMRRKVERLTHASEQICKGAIHRALELKAHVAVCGHTHLECIDSQKVGRRRVDYYNVGSFTLPVFSGIAILMDGSVQMFRIDPELK